MFEWINISINFLNILIFLLSGAAAVVFSVNFLFVGIPLCIWRANLLKWNWDLSIPHPPKYLSLFFEEVVAEDF